MDNTRFPDFLQAGKIVAVHGIRGEVKILPWADEPGFLLDFPVFYLNGRGYQVQSCRVHKTCVLAKLEGVDDVAAAQALRDQVVQIARKDARLEEGTVFIADLIGLPVYCGGEQIGVVTQVLSMPANDVYVVKGRREYMIPAVREFVKEINTREGYLSVSLLEGMETDAP